MIPFKRPELRERLFGGAGTVRVENLAGALTAPFTAALNCELDPGGSVGRHQQDRDDEIVIGLEGEAVIYVNGKATPVVPGTLVALPLGATLEIDNASVDAPFRYLIIKARRG
jgi:quercetin dioxygenase-like cupin family protein